MKLFISSLFRVAADLTKDSKLVTDWVTALGTSGEEAETWAGRHEAMRPMRVRIHGYTVPCPAETAAACPSPLKCEH